MRIVFSCHFEIINFFKDKLRECSLDLHGTIKNPPPRISLNNVTESFAEKGKNCEYSIEVYLFPYPKTAELPGNFKY